MLVQCNNSSMLSFTIQLWLLITLLRIPDAPPGTFVSGDVEHYERVLMSVVIVIDLIHLLGQLQVERGGERFVHTPDYAVCTLSIVQ